MKKYVINESIGNFSNEVFESDIFDEIQEYLQNRYNAAIENGDYEENNEAEEELFYSYFSISEINI